MDIKPKFEVSGRIGRPVPEVFEAFVNPDILSRYFTTGGAKGRIEEGATVMWDFNDFPGAFPVKVVEVEKDKRVVFKWDDGDGGETTVTFRFEPTGDGRTIVSIAEEGWPSTEQGFGKLLEPAPPPKKAAATGRAQGSDDDDDDDSDFEG